jgi:mannose-6-phosphate isomerase-like protein (cupin superfamily)
MLEKNKEISARVREIREVSDVTVEQMAAYLNISTDKYREYEDATQEIPASILYEISQKLNIDMGILLTGKEPKMHIFTVCRKDKGASVERRASYNYQNLASDFIHAKIEPFLVTVEPKTPDIPLSTNSHPGQEFDYVLDGKLKVYIHDNQITLEPGDSILFDSKEEHAMEAIGGKPAKFLAVII